MINQRIIENSKNTFPEIDNKKITNSNKFIFTGMGSSYNSALFGSLMFEEIIEKDCKAEFSSELKRKKIINPEETTLFAISQSGETADTLAALEYAKKEKYLGIVSICNVPTSTMARQSDWKMFTNAGPEIGVASTKAFTTQLAALLILAISIAKSQNKNPEKRADATQDLRNTPSLLQEAFELKQDIEQITENIANKNNALYLGRGMYFSIAQEGALKLKEISYIHAEAYPAGELKHGPLALVDEHIPVVALAPEDSLVEKLLANLEEVKARGGTLYVFGNASSKIEIKKGKFINMPKCGDYNAPIVYTIPLQILAYEVACLRGTDLDQPRNLAKSVTVE